MPKPIRRVVTGHDAAGRSVFIMDGPAPHVYNRGAGNAVVTELWETRATPADNRGQVDAFHRAAIAAGAKDNGPPGLRPNYHANYYAAFVIGPDGHNIEVVCHVPEASLPAQP